MVGMGKILLRTWHKMKGVELLDALPVPVYATDAAGRIKYFNEAAASFWGHRPELGSSKWCGSWRLFTSDGRPLHHDQCPMALAIKLGRAVRGIEAVAERPDGTRVPFLPMPTPIFDESGRLTGAVNLLIDLTERQSAEIDVARLAAIVASSDDAIVSKTLDGSITSWNAGAERIFGYTAAEMIGKPIMMIIPPDMHEEERRILAELRHGRRIEHFETVRVAKDGRLVDISLTVSPMHDKMGNVIGASKVARDITERKRTEALQRLLMDELNHRVKNTLATVQAIANQTLRRAKDPADFAASLNGRVQALARAHTLLTETSWQGAELTGIVRDQLLLTSGADERISYGGASLVLEPQVALHMAMVLHELATNARKYGALSVPGGSLHVTWELARNERRDLILRWQESGGPRVSVPAARGYGTTLIEQSLRAHGGAAIIGYAETGLTCEIRLPRPEPRHIGPALQRAEAVGVGPVATTRPGPIPRSNKKVLLIEDEPLVAMEISSCLSDAGCEIVGPAGSVADAFALIEANRIDAAFVDANLAGDRVDRLAEALAKRGIPFIFVTGYGRERLPLEFRDTPIIGKPFTLEQLLAGLSHMLARKMPSMPAVADAAPGLFAGT